MKRQQQQPKINTGLCLHLYFFLCVLRTVGYGIIDIIQTNYSIVAYRNYSTLLFDGLFQETSQICGAQKVTFGAIFRPIGEKRNDLISRNPYKMIEGRNSVRKSLFHEYGDVSSVEFKDDSLKTTSLLSQKSQHNAIKFGILVIVIAIVTLSKYCTESIRSFIIFLHSPPYARKSYEKH